jgi:hypothetical protein
LQKQFEFLERLENFVKEETKGSLYLSQISEASVELDKKNEGRGEGDEGAVERT